jgi:hypothetical protein
VEAISRSLLRFSFLMGTRYLVNDLTPISLPTCTLLQNSCLKSDFFQKSPANTFSKKNKNRVLLLIIIFPSSQFLKMRLRLFKFNPLEPCKFFFEFFIQIWRRGVL